MRKLKSFTIAELLIAMILTLIVISLGHQGYTIISRTTQLQMTRLKYVSDILQLNRLIDNCVEKANQISHTDSVLLFDQNQSIYADSGEFKYAYGNNQVDVFKLTSAISFEEFSDSLLVKNNSVNLIRLSIECQDTQLIFLFPKQYASDFFMNNSK